jgi:hypothetical protein
MKFKSPAPSDHRARRKAVVVILDIEDHQQTLERFEDAEDLKELKAMRRKPLKFKPLATFAAEYSII